MWCQRSEPTPQTIKGHMFLHSYMQNLRLLQPPDDFLVIHTQEVLELH